MGAKLDFSGARVREEETRERRSRVFKETKERLRRKLEKEFPQVPAYAWIDDPTLKESLERLVKLGTEVSYSKIVKMNEGLKKEGY